MLEQRELLQHHRPLRPRPRLAHGVAAVLVGQRLLDGGLPVRHVLAGQHAAVAPSAGVHDLLGAAERVDRLGDEALRPHLAGALDLLLAASRARGLAQHPRVGFGYGGIGEQRAGLRHLAVAQIDRGRSRPVVAEQLFHGGDGGIGALHQRVAVARIGDGGRQHVGQPHGAVVAQHRHPGIEHAGDAGSEQAGAGHHVEAEAAVMGYCCAGRRRALAADHLDAALARVMDDDGDIAAGPLRWGSTTCRVKAVATAASNALPPSPGSPCRPRWRSSGSR